MRTSLFSAAALASALAAAPALAQTVHIVDENGGADFTDIQPAIDAAADGDTVLVRTGTYFEVFLGGARSLTLAAEEGATVETFQINVHGLAAGKTVTVRGIDPSLPFAFSPQVVLSGNLGHVWLEDFDAPATGIGGGVQVSNSDSVVLTRCNLGGPVINSSTLWIRDSTVHLSDADIEATQCCGIGVEVLGDSTLYVSGGIIRGADGRDALPNPTHQQCLPAEAGLPAIQVRDNGLLFVQGAQLIGGQGGEGISTNCPDAPDGSPYDVVSGAAVELPNPARGLVIDSPVRDGQTASIDVTGEPFDRVLLYYADGPRRGLALPRFDGWLLLSAPRFRFERLDLDASGTATIQVPISIGTLESATFHLQGFHRATGGGWTASAPTSILALDEGL